MTSSPRHGVVASWLLIVLCGGASWSLSVAHALNQPGEIVAWVGALVGTLPVICVAVLSHMASQGTADRVDRSLVWIVMLLSMVMSLSAQAATVDPYMDGVLHWLFPVMSDVATVVGLRGLMRAGKSKGEHRDTAPVHVEASVAVPVHVPVPELEAPVHEPVHDVVPEPVPVHTDVPADVPIPVPVHEPVHANVPARVPVHEPTHRDIAFLSRRAKDMYRDSVRRGKPLTQAEVAHVLGQTSRKLAKRLMDEVNAENTPTTALEGAQNA